MKGMTDRQAQRLIEWLTSHGHTLVEAKDALAYVMGVKENQSKEKGSQKAGKQS